MTVDGFRLDDLAEVVLLAVSSQEMSFPLPFLSVLYHLGGRHYAEPTLGEWGVLLLLF